MKQVLTWLLSCFMFLCVVPSTGLAAEGDEPAFYGEAYLNAFHEKGSSSFTQEVYVEYAFAETVSVWIYGYHDETGQSVYAGLSKNWESGWASGLGVGQSRFDGATQTIIAPWIEYSSDTWELSASAEYSQEDKDLWVRAYIQRHLSEKWSVEVYGESGFGVGPGLVHHFNDHVSLRVVVPIADRENAQVLSSLILTF